MKNKIGIKAIILCGLFAALCAVGAFIKIPFYPVSFTLQSFFCVLAGLLLGGRLAFFSMLAYVGVGLLGVPVFTGGGGIGYVLQPTFGYLLGFCGGALVCGLISDTKKQKEGSLLIRNLTASFCGLFVIYFCGMLYYFILAQVYFKNPIGIGKLFYSFFLIFLPGDGISVVLAAFIAKRLKSKALSLSYHE